MNTELLYEILGETTVQLRKGDVFEGTPELVAQAKAGIDPEVGLVGGGVLEVFDMPPVNAAPDDLFKVDMQFLVIGVDKVKAEARRADLIGILDDWPNPDELASGPSYIAAGATIGDQGAAFCLFALGKALGLWDVITPATFGMTGTEAQQAAGGGFIMCTGWRPEKRAA